MVDICNRDSTLFLRLCSFMWSAPACEQEALEQGSANTAAPVELPTGWKAASRPMDAAAASTWGSQIRSVFATLAGTECVAGPCS